MCEWFEFHRPIYTYVYICIYIDLGGGLRGPSVLDELG